MQIDQKTANRIALIKVLTCAIIAAVYGIPIVVLAALHDGAYGQIIVDRFPTIILSCLGYLGITHGLDILSARFQVRSLLPPASPSPDTAPPPANTPTAPANSPADATPPIAGA